LLCLPLVNRKPGHAPDPPELHVLVTLAVHPCANLPEGAAAVYVRNIADGFGSDLVGQGRFEDCGINVAVLGTITAQSLGSDGLWCDYCKVSVTVPVCWILPDVAVIVRV